MNRAMLLEAIFRISQFIYADLQVIKGNLKPIARRDTKPKGSEEGKRYDEVSPVQAFFMMIELKLKPFHAMQNMRM